MKPSYFIGILFCIFTPAEVVIADTAPLELLYNSSDNDEPLDPKSLECALQITPTQDARSNKLSLGSKGLGGGFGEPILSGDVVSWINSGLKNMPLWGHTLLDERVANSSNKQIVVQPTVHYSYLWFASLRINATLVMSVDYRLPNGELQQFQYRVLGSKNNWVGADSELVTTLNYALNKTIAKIDRDVRGLCQKI